MRMRVVEADDGKGVMARFPACVDVIFGIDKKPVW
jgi:hypothetical protein